MEKSRRYWHVVPGFNYRLTSMQAAIGLAQMERLDYFLTRRDEIVARYDAALSQVPGIILPPRAPWARNIHWLYSILVEPSEAGIDRDALAARLAESGIETRGFFFPLHIMPPYFHADANAFPIATDVSARGLSLPTANDIRLEDVDRVCAAIADIVRTANTLKNHAAK